MVRRYHITLLETAIINVGR